ncbi:Hypothetical protein SRAE_X000236200 [Strongyloides ratti]|uniref:Uncharacterized protein n=1 Tax=Strongyloides ratti TaxID=34506 RepID=A0A090KXM9_STRRB|nr:Hypothetical protein SRAE_X000236200 [Strongyloides ratti]CEF60627.1 Hypothetical protein SRAE_X000236200 [Strongyloides ratti]
MNILNGMNDEYMKLLYDLITKAGKHLKKNLHIHIDENINENIFENEFKKYVIDFIIYKMVSFIMLHN